MLRGLLHRVPDATHPFPRRVVREDEVFDIIGGAHVTVLEHRRRDKVFPHLNQECYGFNKKGVGG